MSKKILIVDDEEDIITFLETFLQNEGYETMTATNGVEAFEELKKETPDLITLDLQMPKNTGTDFFRKVRHHKNFRDIPVIVISGIPGRHLAVPHPSAVFDKPIDKEDLLKAIQKEIG